jgi:hypothetical protein
LSSNRISTKKDWPVFITGQPKFLDAKQIDSTDVCQILQGHFRGAVGKSAGLI